jgi:uncharacterized protein involved in type VI secretion and phage assembly
MSFLPIDRVSQQSSRAAKFRGVYLAVVTDNKDNPPDNPGFRVKVKIPTLVADQTTFYARISVPMGGKDRGAYFLPQVDDQLLVVFEHGDINRPIIIGALWSNQQKPVETNASGKNNTKLIKSRSGHRVIFDDKDGSEKITIVDSTKKNKIILDSANKVVKIESSGDIVIKAKTNVIMHAQSLTLGTTETFGGSTQNVMTHAVSTFGIKASAAITFKGSQVTMNTSGAPACKVTGSGTGELGGCGRRWRRWRRSCRRSCSAWRRSSSRRRIIAARAGACGSGAADG